MPVVYRKLVRDRIPKIIQSEGRRPVTRVLDEGSYRQALLAKLIEEAQEASHATADNLPGELADAAPGARRRQAQPTRRFRKKGLPRISGMKQHDRTLPSAAGPALMPMSER
jgi:predicted house-cleaning noncanonical NTP pyrophosphatase (MazG superfamily)